MAINTTVENINNQPTIEPRTVTGIFTKYIAKTLPLAFDESMSYYECLCALLDYLNETIVPDINNTNEGLEELQEFYIELQNYVNNYFDNLDVQEEINNKLDAMVEDGTMNQIINQEIFGSINHRLDLLDTKKVVLIGDSYLEGYTPDGNVTSWGTNFQSYLGLSNSQVISSYLGGSSFAGSKPFTNLVNALSADNDITDVIVAGGYNDRSFNRTQINTGMTSFKNACLTKFPNAKIWVAMIGWSSASDQLYNLYNTSNNYQICASQLGLGFMSGTEFTLRGYFTMFSSDGIHPNATGQQFIARSIVNAFLNGNATVFQPYTTATFTASGSCTGMNSGSSTISTELNNNIIQTACQGILDFAIDSITYTANGKNEIEVGTFTAGYMVGSNYKMFNIPVTMLVHDTSPGKYFRETGILTIKNGKLYVNFLDTNDSGNNYRSFESLNQIQVMPFSCVFDSMFC